MKKESSPIRLHRETLKRLDDSSLDQAAGGFLTSNYVSCIRKYTCPCTL